MIFSFVQKQNYKTQVVSINFLGEDVLVNSHLFLSFSSMHGYAIDCRFDQFEILSIFLRNLGDTGSPVFQWYGDRWQQVGLVSTDEHCGWTNNLPIYTRIVSYYDWIRSVVNSCPEGSSGPTTTTTRLPPVTYRCDNTSTCGCGPDPVLLTPARIVGGEPALDHSWPMIISLRAGDPDAHVCGGTILSESYILTAAHCIPRSAIISPENLSIAAGMTNLSDVHQIRRVVDQVHVHPEYRGSLDGFRHDIAVLHLKEHLPTESNPLLTRTCIHRIPSSIASTDYIKNGARVTVVGWGTVRRGSLQPSPILRQVELYAIDNANPICVSQITQADIQFCAGFNFGGRG
jgi:hypothetical protein